MKWDKELDDLAMRIAIEHNVPVQNVKDMVEHTFSCVRKSLYDPTMPKILIHNFGTFKVRSNKILGRLIGYQRLCESGKITQDEFDTLKEQFILNLERIENEGHNKVSS